MLLTYNESAAGTQVDTNIAAALLGIENASVYYTECPDDSVLIGDTCVDNVSTCPYVKQSSLYFNNSKIDNCLSAPSTN